MKIEKINDNSIMLSMNALELKERNLEASDLKYGTEKIKVLLTECINKASEEIGFRAEGPLCIEVVPLKDGGYDIIISKSINPDLLDSRFSRFTPIDPKKGALEIMKMLENSIDKFDELIKSSTGMQKEKIDTINKVELKNEEELFVVFKFDEIDNASAACNNVKNFDGKSVFYKDDKNSCYYLVLNLDKEPTKENLVEFNKACNGIAEYGYKVQGTLGMNGAYYDEHYKTIIKENAVEKLGSI